MTTRRISALAFSLGMALLTASCAAQNTSRVAPTRLRTISFANPKPALGLPLDGVSPLGCTTDSLTYLTPAAAPDTGLAILYSVSESAEVKRIVRSVPIEFNALSVLDFFPADPNLVTLVKAEKRDPPGDDPQHGPQSAGPAKPARETAFFLSLSSHDGGSTSLLPLDIHFKPLRIAAFGSGEYLLLGWDEANLLPVLAVLRADGSVRSFMDFDDPKHHADVTLEVLHGAVLKPFGGNILITYPHTTRPLRMLSQFGPGSTLQLAIPDGYLLRDVVDGSSYSRLIARVEMSEDLKAALGKAAANLPAQRIFEFSAHDGARIQEFLFLRQTPADITCAAGQNLTALFQATIAPDTAAPPEKVASPGTPRDQPTQWVVDSVRR